MASFSVVQSVKYSHIVKKKQTRLDMCTSMWDVLFLGRYFLIKSTDMPQKKYFWIQINQLTRSLLVNLYDK